MKWEPNRIETEIEGITRNKLNYFDLKDCWGYQNG